MKSKKIALMLASVMVLSILGGCKSKDVSTNTEKKVIKIMAPLVGAEAPAADNDIELELEKQTGYEVDITWVPNSSYSDKVSITMASNELPDIMVIQGKDASTISAVKKGAFWKLDDYIGDYDNISKANEDVSLNASFNGETYGLYRARDVIRSCAIIRQDWLDKLGLKLPTTVDEFTEILRQFKNNDPDGNGIDDTYGLIIPKWPGSLNSNSPFDQMAVWFGAPNATEIVDGKVTVDFMTPEYMESLEYFKMLYDEGLINKDFAVMDSASWDEPFVNGKGGVIVDTQSRAMSLSKKMAEKNGRTDKNGDEWVNMIGNVAYKNVNAMLPTEGYSGMLMIPKQAVENEKELKDVLDFIDKINSEEVSILLNRGIEGTHYEVKGDKYVAIVSGDETKDKVNQQSLLAYSQIATNLPNHNLHPDSKGTKLEATREVVKAEGLKISVFNETSSLISDVYAKKGAQLQNIMGDARIQYIAGQIDKAGYEDAIKLWLSTGGQEYLDELTALYKEHLK